MGTSDKVVSCGETRCREGANAVADAELTLAAELAEYVLRKSLPAKGRDDAGPARSLFGSKPTGTPALPSPATFDRQGTEKFSDDLEH